MAGPPIHKIRATECGKARRGDAFTSTWQQVSCWSCLQNAPKRPARKVATGPRQCVEGYNCAEKSACRFCNRCELHCVAKNVNSEEEHRKHWDEQPRPTAHRRRR